METQSTEQTTTTQPPSPTETARPNLTLEIVKRAVPRRLPCKLTDEEMLRIARTRVAKEAERDQLVADAKLDAEKRKDQIKEYDDEILVMRRELHSGYQDRVIKTNEVFEKDAAGNCWIVVYRLDTGEPTKERWPASAAQMQRHLPASDGTPGGLLEQAAKMNRSAQPDAEVPADLPSADDDDGEGAGEDEADGDAAQGDKPKKRGNGKGK